jgi:hypothetical protein
VRPYPSSVLFSFLQGLQLMQDIVDVAEDTPLAQMWAGVRTLRYADVSFLSLPFAHYSSASSASPSRAALVFFPLTLPQTKC